MLVRVPATFGVYKNIVTSLGRKFPKVLSLPKLCVSTIRDTSDPLRILEELVREGATISRCEVLPFYVVDTTTFSALRVLHKRRIIEMRVLFVGAAGMEQEVLVARNGRLAHWPTSVLDWDSQFVDELIGD